MTKNLLGRGPSGMAKLFSIPEAVSPRSRVMSPHVTKKRSTRNIAGARFPGAGGVMSGGGVVGGLAIINPTLLLMHFDGTNGSTSFIDAEGSVWGILAGTPTLSTTQAKFGPSSLSGNTSSAIVMTSTPFSFTQTSNFTIEFWVWPAVASMNGGMIVKANYTASQREWMMYLSGGTLFCEVFNSSNTASINLAAGVPAATTWSHIAFVRNGNAYTSYVNGVQAATQTSIFTPAPVFPTLPIAILSQADDNLLAGFNGYIDEVRISNFAVYTAPFTPPTGPFNP